MNELIVPQSNWLTPDRLQLGSHDLWRHNNTHSTWSLEDILYHLSFIFLIMYLSIIYTTILLAFLKIYLGWLEWRSIFVNLEYCERSSSFFQNNNTKIMFIQHLHVSSLISIAVSICQQGCKGPCSILQWEQCCSSAAFSALILLIIIKFQHHCSGKLILSSDLSIKVVIDCPLIIPIITCT